MVGKGFCGVAEAHVEGEDAVATGTFWPTDIEAVWLSVVSKFGVERMLVELVCCNRLRIARKSVRSPRRPTPNICPLVCDSVEARLSRPDRKSTRLNSSHVAISYAVFCLKKKTHN